MILVTSVIYLFEITIYEPLCTGGRLLRDELHEDGVFLWLLRVGPYTVVRLKIFESDEFFMATVVERK